MRFGVLGPLAVWTVAGAPVQVPEAKVRALLASLLIHDGRAVSVDRLADDLWGDRPPGNPTNTLQTKVSQLRRALAAAEPGGRELVVREPAGYALRLGEDALDVRCFRALTARARAAEDPRERESLLSDALDLWRGAPLADFADEPFAAAAIGRWTEERLVAVEERARARLDLGDHALVVGELGDLVEGHPLREGLRALHMRALYLAGRQAEALDQYVDLRRRLSEELGLEPGGELVALHRAILNQDSSLDGSRSPAAEIAVAPPRTNLPSKLTELVGRDNAVRAVRKLVGETRLVTLTGPGGVGKTSLAVETARQLVDTARDGAWLVELAGLDRQNCPESECPLEDWIAEVIAATLGVRDDPASAQLGVVSGVGHVPVEFHGEAATVERGGVREDSASTRLGAGSAVGHAPVEFHGEAATVEHSDIRNDPASARLGILSAAGHAPVEFPGEAATVERSDVREDSASARLGTASAVGQAPVELSRREEVPVGLNGRQATPVESGHRPADGPDDRRTTPDSRPAEPHGAPATESRPPHTRPAVQSPTPAEMVASPDELAHALRAKEMVLVLDNCEQLVEPLARLVARVLAVAPGVRILATSQEPLALPGEVLWLVPALEVPSSVAPLPDQARPADTTAETVLASVRDFSAVRLFVERATAAAPGFVLDTDNAAAVAMICRRLDGIPLALELAATRIRALGATELLNRLDDRFAVLAGGRRGVPARHQTLRAMIDWSWEPLAERERTVLRRLAVHVEGCALDAAEVVCAGDGVEPGEVIEVLTELVDRSLVVCQVHPTTGPRYRLLESVVMYCLERVDEATETELLRRRHADFYLALAERVAPRLRGRDQRRWLDRLDLEAANLHGALETAIELRDGERALRLVSALTWYWFLRGRIREARRSLRSALAVPGGPPGARQAAAAWQAGLAILLGEGPDDTAITSVSAISEVDVRAHAAWFLGYVLSTVADQGRAADLTARALTDFEALGDDWGIAAALCDHAAQAMYRGHLADCDRAATRSAELFDRLGDRWGQLQASFALGGLAEVVGDYGRAASTHRDGLRRAEELGLWAEVSYQLSWLGRTALLTGDRALAVHCHERAMRIAVDQGFKPAEMYAETGLALGARADGAYDVAERHLLRILAWHRGTGIEAGSTLILAELGFVAEQRGEADAALRYQLDGFGLASEGGDPRAISLAWEGLAGAYGLAGDHTRAARLLGAAAATRESIGAPLPAAQRGDINRITARATAVLGAATFGVEFGEGADLAKLTREGEVAAERAYDELVAVAPVPARPSLAGEPA